MTTTRPAGADGAPVSSAGRRRGGGGGIPADPRLARELLDGLAGRSQDDIAMLAVTAAAG